MKYSWAANPQKLERAIRSAGAEGGDEEAVKEKYVLLGGKVLSKPGRPKNAGKAGNLAPQEK